VYDETKILSLLLDKGIIRCRGKIEGAIQNAKVVLALKREFGSFCGYLWSFTDGKVVCNESGAFRDGRRRFRTRYRRT
jgi:DNA-3-methyladenine glycosylase I